MKTGLSILFLVLCWNVARARAHRLDEFLQATTVAVGEEHLRVQVRLTPGIAVAGTVLADLDANGDGIISEGEQQAYAERVRADLSLAVDGQSLPLRPGSQWFPLAEEMRTGLGEILLGFDADVPSGGPGHRLTFENRHRRDIAVYLVNCLVPDDPGLRVTAQSRSFDQSCYQLDYVRTIVRPGAPSAGAGRGTAANAGRLAAITLRGADRILPFSGGVAHRLDPVGFGELLTFLNVTSACGPE